VTGTTYHRTPQDLFKTARALVPGLKRIALVGDPIGRDNFSKTFMKELSATDLGVIDLTRLPMAELKKRISNLPDDVAIAYPGISIDGARARYVPRQALHEISEVTNDRSSSMRRHLLGRAPQGASSSIPTRCEGLPQRSRYAYSMARARRASL
jgi:hypothetical protein